MPTLENSAADLLADMVFGPIWLGVEPWIEFKEAARVGGIISSGSSGGSHRRLQGRWRLWLPGNDRGSRTDIVVEIGRGLKQRKNPQGVLKREKRGRELWEKQ